MRREITIYDIAQKLDVSPSTVSRALKGHHSIGKKTIEAVQNLAKELGYQPNTFATSLRKNKTNLIGVITPRINRPFQSDVISGIDDEADKHGYNVILSQSNDSYNKEIKNAEALFAARVDGVIISFAMETKNYDHFMPFVNKNVPILQFDRTYQNLESNRVIIDNYRASVEAIEYLIKTGCKNIGHLAGLQYREIYRLRTQGYLDALKKNNIPFRPELLIESNLNKKDGVANAAELLRANRDLDAVFCSNDTSAISAVLFFKRVGKRIPEDISIIGFNNDPGADIVEPEITTIEQPGYEMGRAATNLLIKQIENEDEDYKPQTLVIDTRLIIRSSTRKL